MASRQTAPGAAEWRRVLSWGGVIFFVLFGVLLGGYPTYDGEATLAMAGVGWVLFGLVVMSVGLAVWARFLAPARPARAVTATRTAEGPVVEIRLRTVLPATTAILGGVWAAFFGWAWIAGGATGGGLLAFPFALLFLALVPDTLRAVARRPRLRLDQRGLDLRGWSLDAHIDWDDVAAVDVVVPRPERPVIRLTGTGPAVSLTRTWHRIVFDTDLRSEEPVLDIPFLALDDAGRVGAFVTTLRGVPLEERGAHQVPRAEVPGR